MRLAKSVYIQFGNKNKLFLKKIQDLLHMAGLYSCLRRQKNIRFNGQHKPPKRSPDTDLRQLQ